jgi:hypothetical protein
MYLLQGTGGITKSLILLVMQDVHRLSIPIAYASESKAAYGVGFVSVDWATMN